MPLGKSFGGVLNSIEQTGNKTTAIAYNISPFACKIEFKRNVYW